MNGWLGNGIFLRTNFIKKWTQSGHWVNICHGLIPRMAFLILILHCWCHLTSVANQWLHYQCLLLKYLILPWHSVNTLIFSFFFSLVSPSIISLLKSWFSSSAHHSYFFLLYYTAAFSGSVLKFSVLSCFNTFLQLLVFL